MEDLHRFVAHGAAQRDDVQAEELVQGYRET
jgi:hypothetical protein